MSDSIKNFLTILGYICLLGVFGYYAWDGYQKRDLNYSLSYEDKVIKTTTETICKSIKHEYLTIKCD